MPLEPIDILLAEDNEVNVLVMKAMLDGTPCRLDIATHGEAALARFRRRDYGLVLMDIHMPGIDGYATTRALREIERESGRDRTPVVALTASALDTDRDASRAAGCDDHLVKPIGRVALLAAIATWGRPTATSTSTSASAAAPASRTATSSATPPSAGADHVDDDPLARRRAHARVFLGTWRRGLEATIGTSRASALCADLQLVADGIGETTLAVAASRLARALAGGATGELRDAREAVEREMRRVEARLGDPD